MLTLAVVYRLQQAYVRAAWRLAASWGDERGWVRVRVRVYRVRTGGVEAGGQLG